MSADFSGPTQSRTSSGHNLLRPTSKWICCMRVPPSPFCPSEVKHKTKNKLLHKCFEITLSEGDENIGGGGTTAERTKSEIQTLKGFADCQGIAFTAIEFSDKAIKDPFSLARTRWLAPTAVNISDRDQAKTKTMQLTQVVCRRSRFHVLIVLHVDHNVEISFHVVCCAGSFWSHNISKSPKEWWEREKS